ncbi:type II toxin-antitoxin system VapC family toxin [Natronolimnobius baerhuensis]|uniref:PIN domain-containing protein n=1 Tax=Natronolimnobius baerhuensis TaxID=253108 RepID=A0A202EBH3_9EURY|nr:PIN domain-containing protein [Natronolimnobius baerhuensis]OVE85571.1 hypothetical protein B2G88_01735 [Natronolimnobius baerhuensis]
MVLLDSTFLIDLFDEDDDAIAALETFDWRDASVSLITVTEVRRGLPEEKIEEFDSILREVGVVQYTIDEGHCALQEHKRLTEDKKSVDNLDLMVAATAIVADEPILTREPETYEPTQAQTQSY